MLGVALGDAIYLWNANDGSIQQLMQTTGEQTHVTSLCWCPEGTYMAVGTSDHKVQRRDVDKLRQVRSMTGHRARLVALVERPVPLERRARLDRAPPRRPRR